LVRCLNSNPRCVNSRLELAARVPASYVFACFRRVCRYSLGDLVHAAPSRCMWRGIVGHIHRDATAIEARKKTHLHPIRRPRYSAGAADQERAKQWPGARRTLKQTEDPNTGGSHCGAADPMPTLGLSAIPKDIAVTGSGGRSTSTRRMRSADYCSDTSASMLTARQYSMAKRPLSG